MIAPLLPLWARHDSASMFCAVVSVVLGQSATTACNGRWAAADIVEFYTHPAEVERCDACQHVLVERGFVERALAELVFDVSDADGDASPLPPPPHVEPAA